MPNKQNYISTKNAQFASGLACFVTYGELGPFSEVKTAGR